MSVFRGLGEWLLKLFGLGFLSNLIIAASENLKIIMNQTRDKESILFSMYEQSVFIHFYSLTHNKTCVVSRRT